MHRHTLTMIPKNPAWYSLFYYDYYMYTLDKDFLRERALPFMEQAEMCIRDRTKALY